MSVVVCSYNGETTLARTLDSLVVQDYPGKFEIIVVNDGSTDKTSQIAKKYKEVRCIDLAQNVGISGARNAGMDVVKGEIYVAMDDDCLVRSDWLTQLAKGYALPDPAGVGGYLVDQEPIVGVTKNYISTIGGGFAPKVNTGSKPASIPVKLLNYLGAGLKILSSEQATWIEAVELYGANCSFPIDVLRAVGGWDKKMTGIEDRDVCLRIRNHFPGKHFYAIRAAEVMHDPDISLWTYLKRPYVRGYANYRFHAMNHFLPPLFPLPFMLVALCALAAVHEIEWTIPTLILLPQLLYFWWPFFAVSKMTPSYFLFPYIQFAEESAVILGLLRGFLKYKKEKHANS
ncbi:MAG TPA: glycosyltransferase [Patescibacteria group bacterium]|nr:glycosyltransferase [Patescibacteria group bacterium]